MSKYLFRSPLSIPTARGGKPPEPRRSIEYGILIERDVAVSLRDGVRIYVDVFRPLDEQPAAPLIAWGPYGKHVPNEPQRFPGAGVLRPEPVAHDAVIRYEAVSGLPTMQRSISSSVNLPS